MPAAQIHRCGTVGHPLASTAPSRASCGGTSERHIASNRSHISATLFVESGGLECA